MGGPVAEDSGRDNRAAIAQVQARQRQLRQAGCQAP